MAQYNIVQYPDERLTRKGYQVTDFNDEIRQIVANMFETHYSYPGCAALAATQLAMDNPPHITVIDFSEKKNEPLCLVNTRLTEPQGETNEREGCMSVPGRTFKSVKRAEIIQVDAQDEHGKAISFRAEGFMAKCIQHEVDHLHGILFIDHLSRLQRKIIDQKLLKLKKSQ